MYYSVSASTNSFSIQEIDRPSSKRPGSALDFLSKVNYEIRKISSSVFSNDQANEIEKTIEDVRNRCKSKSWLYWIQSKINPFSNAYKIEQLSSQIFSFIKPVKLEIEKIQNNKSDPFEFFPIFKSSITKLEREEGNSEIGFLWCKKSPLSFSLDRSNYMNQEDVFSVPVFVDEKRSYIRLLNEEEMTKNTVGPEFSTGEDVFETAKELVEFLKNQPNIIETIGK